MKTFTSYGQAYDYAGAEAAKGQAYGIEKCCGPLQPKGGYNVFMIPNLPERRFGRDYTCQAVEAVWDPSAVKKGA